MAKKEISYFELEINKKDTQFEKSIVELVDIFNMTKKDCDEMLAKHSEEPENQLWRRLFIKAVYSHIEAICFNMKQMTYYLLKRQSDRKLKIAEVAMLLEKSYYLDRQGKAVTRKPPHIKPQWNLQFALKTFARATGNKNFILDKKNEGWQSYSEGVDIRNRITHPKNVSDLRITDEEIMKIKKALKWFREKFRQLIELKRMKRNDFAKKLKLKESEL